MRTRTFCILLAGFMMLVGGLSNTLMKMRKADRAEERTAVVSAEKTYLESPVGEWRVMEAYGAQYSEELSQWTGREAVLLRTETGERLTSPMDGRVISVAAVEEGGSRIIIEEGEVQAAIGPVRGVGVFEGSYVKAGDYIGMAEGGVSFSVRINNISVDPAEMVRNAEEGAVQDGM